MWINKILVKFFLFFLFSIDFDITDTNRKKAPYRIENGIYLWEMTQNDPQGLCH